jgi:AcrR family transcriptional regulator
MSYVAERRQEEKDRRRTEIIDAAIEVYREVDWDGVTIDQVAKRARLSRALVYVYFKDKEELHAAIVLKAFELLATRFTEAAARARLGIDKIEAIGRAYVAFAHELPHYFDACARFEACAPGLNEPHTHITECFEAGGRVHQIVIEAILQGQSDGSVRPDLGDPKVTAIALWGFSHGLIQIAMNKAHVLAHENIAVPQLIEQAIRMFRLMLTRP